MRTSMQQPLSKKFLKSGSAASSPSKPASTSSAPESLGPSGSIGLVASPLTFNQLAYLSRIWLTQLIGNDAIISRTTAHLVVLLLVVLAINLGNIQLRGGSITALRPSQQTAAQPAPTAVAEETGAPLILPAQLTDLQDDVLVPAAVPHTIIPERPRGEISTYTVENGDTIYGIAAKFGLDPETIVWSNPDLEKAPDLLDIGQELTILPVNGVYHQVGEGDTVESLASTLKTDPTAIINDPLNKLDPDNPVLVPGQWVIVPGGSKPFTPRAVVAYTGDIPESASTGTGAFAWPTSGTIYQGFFSWHPAIDIAAYIGAPVIAADSGYVIVSGWTDIGYGLYVVVDHGNGYQTLYAHLNAIYVNTGDNVAKGQQIGEMGDTGNTTGPHLHFEVRQNTVQRNPVGFLP